MQVQIKEIRPFTIVGVASRHTLPNVKRGADIPAYWNTIALDYGKHLTRLYDAFTPAKHGENGLCFDVDEETGEFMYLLGVPNGAISNQATVIYFIKSTVAVVIM